MMKSYEKCSCWFLEDQPKASPLKLMMGEFFFKHFPGQMTCGEFENFVVDYHEGALPAETRKKLDFHFKICPMCQTHFSSYVRTVELGKRVCEQDDDPVPEDVPEELVSAILAARSDE